MTNQQYLDDVLWAYSGEFYGREMFEVFGMNAENDDVKSKCFLLRDLEDLTLQKMKPVILRYQLSFDEEGMCNRGRRHAQEYVEKGWVVFLESLSIGVDNAIQRIKPSVAAAPPEDKEAMSFFLNHEKALADFIGKELDGEQDSMKAVRALLKA